MLTVALTGLVPTGTAASADIVGTLDLPLQPNGAENGIVGASAVHYKGATYVIGGRHADGTYSDKIHKYEHASGRVTRDVATLPLVSGSENGGRQSGAATLIGDRIYYFGGAALVKVDMNNDGTPETVPRAINDILEFNPATNQVTRLAQTLPAGAWGIAASSSGSKAYLFGGFSFDITNPAEIDRKDWILRFEPGADPTRRIQTLASRLPYAVQDAAAALVGNRIYVFGGLADNDETTNPCPMSRYYNSENESYEERRLSVCTTGSIVSFDPGAEIAMSYAHKLEQPAQFLSAGTVGGKAYIPGGRLSDGTALASITEFSPSANPPLRTLVPTMPRGVFGAPATVDGTGNLFVFGGRFGGIADLTDDIVRISPGATVPFPPRSLATTQIPGGVRLEWETPAYDGDSPVLGYRVYRAEVGHNETKIAEVTGLSHDDTTARPGAQYAYRVTAVNAVGESPGASTSRETDATVPGAVQNLAAYAGNEEVLLRWSAPDDNGGSAITGYRVYRDGTLLRSLPPLPLQFRDGGVENGQTYAYVVRAVNVKGEGAGVPARTVTPAAVPQAPTAVQAAAVVEGVHVQWMSAGADVERFIVYRGELPGAIAPIGEVDGTEFLDVDVERGRTYYYAIAAGNAVGESPPSEIVRVSLVRQPGAPENVFAAPLEGAVRITWSAPQDTGEAAPEDLRYYVSRQSASGGGWTVLNRDGDLATTSFVDARVLPGLEYVYTVTTLNPLESEPSAAVRASPKAIANKMPVAFLEADALVADVREQILFDAGKSSDPDGRIQFYLFDFGDGSEVVNQTSGTIQRAFPADAYYTVTLRVVDDRGATSDPVSLTLKVGTPADDGETGANRGGGETGGNGGGETNGATTRPGETPGPGVALVLVALGALALVLRGRRR